MSLLLKNALLFGHEGTGDVFIENGRIASLIASLDNKSEADRVVNRVIDCSGHLLLPALTDMQVFTGGLGASGDDALADLNDAALAGGVGSLLLMPDGEINGIPGGSFTGASFYRAAPITDPGNSEKLAEMGFAYQKGARAFCDGALSIVNSETMRRAMHYAADMDALVMHQPLDRQLAGDGVMNEGIISARLGLSGIPAAAEIVMVARDIELARITGVKYHAAQISCAGALDLIRDAKNEGLPISCGVSINHLLLNEEAIGDWRTFCKLIPPLRTEQDRLSLLRGLAEGVIDVIVSAHNPQSQETKRLPFELAGTGAVGLETLLAGCLTLHHRENIPLDALISALTINPARLIGLPAHALKEGHAADLALCDMKTEWVLDVTQPHALHSQSQNAALDGRTFYGKNLMTLIGGEIVFDARSN